MEAMALLDKRKEDLHIKIQELKLHLDEAKEVVKQKSSEVSEAKATLNSVTYRTQQQIDGLKHQAEVFSDALSKYGDHAAECGFTELISIGKLTEEHVSCTCGWHEFKTKEEL